MPPGSRVAPGSWRATVRSWVSSRVASAYGWGLRSARTACTWCIVPAAKRPSAGEHQPLRRRPPGSPAGRAAPAVDPVRPPATSSAAAATPSSASALA